jgi:transposase
MSQNDLFFVGIDISKDYLDLAWGEKRSEHVRIKNTVEALDQWLGGLGIDECRLRLVAEHTGSYTHPLIQAAANRKIYLWLINAESLHRAFIQVQRSKSDKKDAHQIYRFAIRHQADAKAYAMPSVDNQRLHQWSIFREQLTHRKTMAVNQLRQKQLDLIPNALILELLEQEIQGLDEKIAQADREIQVLLSGDTFKGTFNILHSIPGFGKVICTELLLLDLSRFESAKQLSSYIGVAPINRTSGSSVRYRTRCSAHMTKRKLKALLYQGVLAACTRSKSYFYDFYQQLKAKGTHHLKIMNVIVNQLIKLIFVLLEKKECFNKETYRKNKNSWAKDLILA